MADSQKWSDLAPRIMSGVVMIVIGMFGIWMGGHVFHVLVAVVCGLMVWELVGMLRPGVRDAQLQFGVLAGLTLLVTAHLPMWLALVIVLGAVLLGASRFEQNRKLFGSYALLIMCAGLAMTEVHDEMGFGWMMWLVTIVVVTDVVGYFAGRMIGGPKFWPAVSPKKTWSGTAAGWVGAAVVGLIFSINTGLTGQIVLLSILLSFASQMGDIAESALKRKTGIKDSSNLIPGHGGLMDRFDGMLGASVCLLVLDFFVGFSHGLG